MTAARRPARCGCPNDQDASECRRCRTDPRDLHLEHCARRIKWRVASTEVVYGLVVDSDTL